MCACATPAWCTAQHLSSANISPTWLITAKLINGLGADQRYGRVTSSGTISFLTDQLGSTLALAGSGGSPSTEYTYGPFGASTTTGTSSSNPYRYTGWTSPGLVDRLIFPGFGGVVFLES